MEVVEEPIGWRILEGGRLQKLRRHTSHLRHQESAIAAQPFYDHIQMPEAITQLELSCAQPSSIVRSLHDSLCGSTRPLRRRETFGGGSAASTSFTDRVRPRMSTGAPSPETCPPASAPGRGLHQGAIPTTRVACACALQGPSHLARHCVSDQSSTRIAVAQRGLPKSSAYLAEEVASPAHQEANVRPRDYGLDDTCCNAQVLLHCPSALAGHP